MIALMPLLRGIGAGMASACIFSCLNSKVNERRAREYCPTYISRSVLCGLGCFALGLIDAVITVLCGGMFII